MFLILIIYKKLRAVLFLHDHCVIIFEEFSEFLWIFFVSALYFIKGTSGLPEFLRFAWFSSSRLLFKTFDCFVLNETTLGLNLSSWDEAPIGRFEEFASSSHCLSSHIFYVFSLSWPIILRRKHFMTNKWWSKRKRFENLIKYCISFIASAKNEHFIKQNQMVCL